MILIDGKKIASDILENTKQKISKLDFKPIFCDVLMGNNPSSAQYVKMKNKTAESVGIQFHNANFPESITTNELIKEIKILNKIENMCGIIIQLPLPESIDKRAVLDSIDPFLDVDCLGTLASKKFYNNYDEQTDLGYPTALACMALLDSLDLNLKEKAIVVMGQGELVGKPTAALLRYRGLTYSTVTSRTGNKENLLRQADVVISGIGRGKYITGNMIKNEAVLIDAGTSEEVNGPPSIKASIVGDVDLESVKNMAGYISPVPGGVGPVTVAMLLKNVLKVAQSLAKARAVGFKIYESNNI